MITKYASQVENTEHADNDYVAEMKRYLGEADVSPAENVDTLKQAAVETEDPVVAVARELVSVAEALEQTGHPAVKSVDQILHFIGENFKRD